MSFADVIRGVDVTAIAQVLEAHGHDPGLAERWAQAGRRALGDHRPAIPLFLGDY